MKQMKWNSLGFLNKKHYANTVQQFTLQDA